MSSLQTHRAMFDKIPSIFQYLPVIATCDNSQPFATSSASVSKRICSNGHHLTAPTKPTHPSSIFKH